MVLQPYQQAHADEAGLNSQAQTMISLILDQKKLKAKAASKVKKGTKNPLKTGERNEGFIQSCCALVICPILFIRQWVEEVQRCCKPGQLNIYSYHGPNRESRPEILAKYDMVITSYILAGSDPKYQDDEALTSSKNQPPLQRVFWDCIILDKADLIKNHKNKMAIGICQLMARTRWALTDAPIQNNILDMSLLLTFLRCKPFDDYHVQMREVEDAALCRQGCSALFDELSRNFPAGKYTTFCNRMGVCYNEATNMLTRYKEDYNVALRNHLYQWDLKMNGVTKEQLEDALYRAEVGGLCSIVRKHYENASGH